MTRTTPRAAPGESNRAQSGATASARQRSQSELLDHAMKMPGVAEIVDLYARYAPYAPQPGASRVIVRHSTGGNG